MSSTMKCSLNGVKGHGADQVGPTRKIFTISLWYYTIVLLSTSHVHNKGFALPGSKCMSVMDVPIGKYPIGRPKKLDVHPLARLSVAFT